MQASIELRFGDSVILLHRGKAPVSNKVFLAGAVHRDSEIASVVKAQVKRGSSKQLDTPRLGSSIKLKPKEGAIKYSVRFLYRPASFLIAVGLMPDPNPAPLDDVERNASAGSSAQADANAKKRKRSARPALGVEGASAGGSETTEQRKKRITAELLAVKRQQLEAELEAIEQEQAEGQGADKASNGGANQEVAVKLEEGAKGQKIYLELSDDDD